MPIRPVYEIHHFILSCDVCGVEFMTANQGIDQLIRLAQAAGWTLKVKNFSWAETYCPKHKPPQRGIIAHDPADAASDYQAN